MSFPSVQAAPLYGRFSHTGFKDPITISQFLFTTLEVAVKILKPIAIMFQTAAFMRCSFQMNGNNRNSLPVPFCGDISDLYNISESSYNRAYALRALMKSAQCLLVSFHGANC